MRESDIMYENGDYWVGSEKDRYTVYCPYGIVASVTDSSYRKDADGLSIAKARCDYLARRAREKACKSL